MVNNLVWQDENRERGIYLLYANRERGIYEPRNDIILLKMSLLSSLNKVILAYAS
jgi:hypothetical protein